MSKKKKRILWGIKAFKHPKFPEPLVVFWNGTKKKNDGSDREDKPKKPPKV